MKSLLSNYFDSVTKGWSALKDGVKKCAKLPYDIEGLSGSSASFFAAEFMEERRFFAMNSLQYGETKGKTNENVDASFLDFIVVCPSERDVHAIRSDLESALKDSVDFFELPWWSAVPYRPAPSASAIFGQRAGTLCALCEKKNVNASSRARVFLMSERAFLTPVPPKEFLRSLLFSVFTGQKIEPEEISERLSHLGYNRVPKVALPGEFSVRGEVLDVFLGGGEPVRINFDFDEICSIKLFDVETQTTTKKITRLTFSPMKEVVWNEDLISTLDNALKNEFGENENCQTLVDSLKTRGECEGEELFYPVLWEKSFSVLDLVGKGSTLFLFDYDRLFNALESLEREFLSMYKRTMSDSQNLPVFPPNKMLNRFDITEQFERTIFFHSIRASDFSENETKKNLLKIDVNPPQSFFGNFALLREHFTELQKSGWRIFIFADNENQALRIEEIFKDFTSRSPSFSDKIRDNALRHLPLYELEVFPAAISAGFGIAQTKTLVVQENEIFGRRKQKERATVRAKSEVIEAFVDLNEGDYVVHSGYGIGQFKGIQRLKASGAEKDYIKIEYAQEEFLYVPLEQLNLVQRYIGSGGAAPRLDTLGGKSWENRKGKVKKAVEELAEKLLSLYGKRKIARGFAFSRVSDLEAEFDAAFPYEDTPDQFTATKEIKADMEKPIPMDRLLCGDVGYGKTEVALRAAFKAVLSKKQVAFLAPTTLLAEQHFETSEERFRGFPVIIKHLSRFVPQKEQKKILAELKEGKIDILIGTHRIIQKDVEWADLGLMIIDEEQRFGVKDKERLKTLKTNIDCLSMSATPIPRTLQMSLLKIRDMSVLATPPQARKPIETSVEEADDEKIARAIRREVERGGQVFFLHNRVETLDDTRRKLEQLLPELLIDTAHGQMSSDELDDIFRRFKMGGFHVLVATTIIENGIDIPNVNTIIIDRADMYGISQLYQLRGRVGRSDRTAYAYLFYPKDRALSELAMKRLQAISDFTELGSGFKIAMKDMEIRGAGNLLGRDQSGDVYSVGFDLYVRLLSNAIERLTKENYVEQTDALLELEYTGFIPDRYIPSTQTKMEIYKKIASIPSKDALETLELEIMDRFGPIPEEMQTLLSLSEVRLLAKKLKIDSMKEKNGSVCVTFRAVSDIPVKKFLRLLAAFPTLIHPAPEDPRSFYISALGIQPDEKADFFREKLEALV